MFEANAAGSGNVIYKTSRKRVHVLKSIEHAKLGTAK
jgi:hypothetical protein